MGVAVDGAYSKHHTVIPPDDKCNFVYLVMLLSGVGFLLPYNSFITAVDFFQGMFPGSTIIFDISLVYILTALIAVLLNNIIIETFSLNVRIMFGYLLSLIILSVFLIGIVWLQVCNPEQTYALILLLIAVLSFGATVQQSSFYGLTGLLPPKYTQAVMTGESVAGCLACSNRIISKWIIENTVTSTAVFIFLSIIIIIICSYNFYKVQSCELIHFYMNISYKEKEADLRGKYDSAHVKTRENKTTKHEIDNTGNAKTETQILIEDAEYYQLPEFSASCRTDNVGVRVVVEDVMVEMTGKSRKIGGDVRKCMAGIKFGIYRRLIICYYIWPYMLGMGLTYMVTLTLFPGVETMISSCKLGSWTTIILMAVFNITDLIGKLLAGISSKWSPATLVVIPIARFTLIPLILLAVARPSSDWLSVSLTAILGLSNGLFGSLPIILAPRRVSQKKGGTELTGNLMTGAYCLGLTLGAGAAYFCDWILGDVSQISCSDSKSFQRSSSEKMWLTLANNSSSINNFTL